MRKLVLYSKGRNEYQTFPFARINSIAYNLALSELNSNLTSTSNLPIESIFQAADL